MKYFLSAGIYHIDAVVIVLGWRPYLDICDFEKQFFCVCVCGGPYNKALWIHIKHSSLSWTMPLHLKGLEDNVEWKQTF